jgi:Flp pilus assembly CpaF family ATPase
VPFPFRPDDNDILAGRASSGKETTLKSLLDSAGLNEEGRVIVVPTSREPAPASTRSEITNKT